jgi:hypothetical protein
VSSQVSHRLRSGPEEGFLGSVTVSIPYTSHESRDENVSLILLLFNHNFDVDRREQEENLEYYKSSWKFHTKEKLQLETQFTFGCDVVVSQWI